MNLLTAGEIRGGKLMGQYCAEDHTNHPILLKHDELLTLLSVTDRVVDIAYDDKKDKFHLIEQCDEYFRTELDKETCQELSELFAELAGVMK
jgi:thiamine biosynthesis protein ThiC